MTEDNAEIADTGNAAEASLIASTVLSVVRERSISSAYGLYMKMLQDSGCDELPPYEDFFAPCVEKRLKLDIEERLGKGALNLPLYSGEGDLFSQLSRLLVLCNETLSKKTPELINEANKKIGALDFPHQANNNEYIRHLRNAVLHGHFEVSANENIPFENILHFWDEKNGNETGNFFFNAESLNAVIDILLNDVCLAYLNEIGWTLE